MPDYSGHEEEVSPDQHAKLVGLVDRLDAAEKEAEGLEVLMKAAEARARELREKDIPDLMESIGLKELVTASGLYVKLKEEVRASFFSKEPERREPAYEWLRDNHHDGLIKNRVEVQFNREQDALANEVVEMLRNYGKPMNISQKKDINHQTLLAFLREQLREGTGVPLEKFGAFVQRFAKVERKPK